MFEVETMEKKCEVCGKTLNIENRYAYYSTKYCAECAKDVKRKSDNERIRRLRAAEREKKKNIGTRCKRQLEELEFIKAELERLSKSQTMS